MKHLMTAPMQVLLLLLRDRYISIDFAFLREEDKRAAPARLSRPYSKAFPNSKTASVIAGKITRMGTVTQFFMFITRAERLNKI